MLKDLNLLGEEAKIKCGQYNKAEFELSDQFKNEFNSRLSGSAIEYKKNTFIVKTSSNLVIIAPNQWLVIATYFTPFLKALKEYKAIIDKLGLQKEKVEEFRKNKILDEETKNKITILTNSTSDYENINKFLTDYDWWYGSKTIDRGDYFVSSILKLANVVNTTQSYIADLTNILSDNEKLINLLIYDLEVLELKKNKNLIVEKNLRNIIFKSFKYLLSNYDEDIIIEGYEIKKSLIEDRKYNGLTLPKYFGFEIVLAIFDKPLNLKNLKSSSTKRYFEDPILILKNNNTYFTTQWNLETRGLSLSNFNIYLENVTKGDLKIIKENDFYKLVSNNLNSLKSENAINKIFYGAPGTGKSHKVKELISGKEERTERVTFHPEYDYNAFVGGYKPTMDGKDIRYEFVPQAFTNIYVKAWNDLDNDYYLVIEEINRGNCAEIFGDIFQLLDRTNDYHITPSKELKEYLTAQFSGNANIDGQKLILPPNLNILATMNTSDQSLFPMDSAFKRRWDWEYIPINDSFSEENKSSKFKVKLSETEYFSWLSFILSVNSLIKQNENLGMDKCLGNYFIKTTTDIIEIDVFINKAIFYLWNDVFKDEMEENNIFLNKTTYEDFFPIQSNGIVKLKEILEILKIEITAE
jgi:hypothetical protein